MNGTKRFEVDLESVSCWLDDDKFDIILRLGWRHIVVCTASSSVCKVVYQKVPRGKEEEEGKDKLSLALLSSYFVIIIIFYESLCIASLPKASFMQSRLIPRAWASLLASEESCDL